MEACMMKPEVKKKPKPPKPPPKPTEIKRNDPATQEKPTPLVPQRPTDAELSQTQYRIKRAANKEANENLIQPVVPPRLTEKELNATTRFSQHRRVQADDTRSQSKVPKDEADFKQSDQSAQTGMFHRSQKEKTPSFTSYLIHDEEEKNDDVPAKQTPGSKPGGLKGVMKGLQMKSSPKVGREPSPDSSTEEAGSEKEQSAEINKQEKNAEPKQDIGDLIAGMFRKTPKEKVSPAVTVSKVDRDPEDAEDEEKGGFFSGILKKSNKTTDETPALDNLSVHSELSASSDSLSEKSNNKEKGAIFSGMFKKKPREAAQTDESPNITGEGTPGQEKGGVFSGIFKKSPKLSEAPRLQEGAESLHSELSASTDSLSEDKEKGGLFSGLLRKTPKTTGEENLSAQKDLSASNDSLSEAANTKERGSVFSGIFKRSSRPADSPPTEEDSQSADDELSGSREALNNKEKGGIFSGIFKKTPKPTEAAQSEEDESLDNDLSTSTENLSENKQEKGGGLFSGLLKKTPKASGERSESPEQEAQKELTASNDDLSENTAKDKNFFSNIFKKPHKPADGGAADKELLVNTEKQLSGSCENLFDSAVPKEKKGGLAGIFKRSASIDNLFDEEKGGLFSGLLKKTPKASGDEAAAEAKDEQKELSASNDSLFENSNTKEKGVFSGMFKKTPKPAEGTTTDDESSEDKKLSGSCENLLEANTSKEKTGGLAGIFKKSPKPAKRSIATEDPLSDTKELSASCDSLTEIAEDNLSALGELSASDDNLSETTSTTKEKKGGFAGIFRRTPKTEQQESEDMKAPQGGRLRRRRTIKKKRRVVSFRVKKTLPNIPKLHTTSQSSEMMPVIDETVELQELNPAQENTVEVQPVEMAAYPTEDNTLEAEQESDELIEWWNTVKGWAEWNETSHFQEDEAEMVMEQAADRVYMAARLFVRLFNQRGASLQHRILELMALADAADQFHKKTVQAAVGGGVASVAGSLTTITGLILAPFTFGASIIVTAVGIGVATAGSITSATANITDTVHSNMDRKKLEKMIQDYQEEIKDIRECLEFVQAGMDTLQEWDFEKYSESAAKKALNHNLKHVMKEGGRAGKALMVNTDKLISTVQVLGAAGGAAKAAQAISVTTGVMSALFLALDVFFLAKDSHKLRKGAKTKFASKIRDVCKELQDGLLELNKVKTQLQKTMDGIEVEEYEEIEEVEVEVDDDFESDPKKLAELEQELDLLEEKLDKKAEEEQKKKKEIEKEILKNKNEKKEENSLKEKGELEEKRDKEEMGMKESKKGKGEWESKISDEEKEQKNETVKVVREDVLKEQPPKGKKKDKETENQITAGKEKHESKRDQTKEDGTNKKTGEKERNKTEKEHEEIKSRSGDSKREDQTGKVCCDWVNPERESEKSKSSREDESVKKPEWKSINKQTEAESVSTRRHSGRSDKERRHSSERGSQHETKVSDKERDGSRDSKQSDRTERSRRTEEERGVRDWRAEAVKGGEEKREVRETERGTKRDDHGRRDSRKESHRSHQTVTKRGHSEREWRSSREESDPQRSHHRRGTTPHDDQRERGDEKRASRIESARRKFESAGGEEEEERGKRKEDGVRAVSDRERRRSDRDREHKHSRRGSRPGSKALLEDGLNI